MTLREVNNRGMMSLETLETIIKRAFEECTDFCTFGFQGGEPTLAGLDFFKTLIKFQKKYNKKNIPIMNTIQTNGSTIDADWAEFFFENKFLVGISIDGTKEIHDYLRPDASGKGTFHQCIKSAQLLKKHKADFNILCVITRQVARHPEKIYNFFKKHDFRYIQLIPCLDGLKEEHGSNDYSLNSEAFGDFLKSLFDMWYQDFIQGNYYSIRTFDNYINLLLGNQPENCAMSGFCQSYPVIEADGSVYPCDFYMLDEYRIGSVKTDSFETMLSGDTSENFAGISHHIHEKCITCSYNFICRGGCRRDREPFVDGKPSLNYYCSSYMAFFEHALPRMQAIAENIRK